MRMMQTQCTATLDIHLHDLPCMNRARHEQSASRLAIGAAIVTRAAWEHLSNAWAIHASSPSFRPFLIMRSCLYINLLKLMYIVVYQYVEVFALI